MMSGIEALHALVLSVAAPVSDCSIVDGTVNLPAGQTSCTIPSKNPITPTANELIYGLISFLVFFAFMAKYVLPKANQTLADRREMIEGKIEHAESDRADAEQLLVDYRAQLTDARGEASRIIEEANKRAESIVAARSADAHSDAERILTSAHAKAESERQLVVSQLRGEIGGLSLQLAERIVGAALESDERQRQLIDSFIAEVEGGQDAEHAAELHSASAGG